MKQLKNERGLTLVELLAVIVILAIIAAIAAVAIGNVISNSKDKAILSDAANIIAGAKIAYMDGVCDEGQACDQDKLKSFVENAKAKTYAVNAHNVNGEVTYTIKMGKDNESEFTKIKNDKYKPGKTGVNLPTGVKVEGEEYTEAQILAAMNGEGEKGTTTPKGP